MATEAPERPWSRDDLLSVSDAARRIPIREADARELAGRVARLVPGSDRRLVVWGDVLDLLRPQASPAPVVQPRPAVPYPRVSLSAPKEKP